MVVHNQGFLIHLDLTVLHLSDSDSSYELVVVNGGNQKLGFCIRIPLRCGNKVYNSFEKRLHIHIRIFQLQLCISVLGRSKEEGAIQLLVGSI